MESAIQPNDTTKNTIPNTSAIPQEGSEPQTSEQTTKQKPIASAPRTVRVARAPSVFTLLDLAQLEFSLPERPRLNAQDATEEEFRELADSVASVTNVAEWYLEERRDFINSLYAWCAEHPEVPFPFTRVDEEKRPTVPLTLSGAEESGFLHDVERARPVMISNPDIDAAGLAAALGLKSVLYAQTVKVYANAHQEGA